jgi:hypothetical protein
MSVALPGDDGLGRVQTRLWLFTMTALTILATVWCITLGPIAAILSLVVAKHILVALLAMALNIDSKGEQETQAA